MVLTAGGVEFEDHPLVREFLSQSVFCGVLGGKSVSASVLDLMRLRTKGYASPPFHYQVQHATYDGNAYIQVGEQIRHRDGTDFPGAPGRLIHTYRHDDGTGQFPLVDSSPENADFRPEMVRELGNPVGFLALHKDAVCNGAYRLEPVKIAQEDGGRAKPSAAADARVETGIKQWSSDTR